MQCAKQVHAGAAEELRKRTATGTTVAVRCFSSATASHLHGLAELLQAVHVLASRPHLVLLLLGPQPVPDGLRDVPCRPR